MLEHRPRRRGVAQHRLWVPRSAALLALALCLQLTGVRRATASTAGLTFDSENRVHVIRDSSARRGLQSIKSEVLQKTAQLNQGEPEEWVAHFKRRQLLQSGSATGGIVAISPSGAPLLRRASRLVPSGQPQLLEVQNGSSGNNGTKSFLEVHKPLDASAPAMAPSLSADNGACYTLAYQGGYASISGSAYETVRFTSDKGQCCELCEEDPNCAAWTRVAGGQASTRACYLMSSLNSSTAATLGPAASVSAQAIGPSSSDALPPTPFDIAAGPSASPVAAAPAAAATPGPAPAASADQHANGSAVIYLPESSATIMESGTKAGTELPAELYGCPYPPTSTGQCKPPTYCNCFDGVCYGSCQGNDLQEGLAG